MSSLRDQIVRFRTDIDFYKSIIYQIAVIFKDLELGRKYYEFFTDEDILIDDHDKVKICEDKILSIDDSLSRYNMIMSLTPEVRASLCNGMDPDSKHYKFTTSYFDINKTYLPSPVWILAKFVYDQTNGFLDFKEFTHIPLILESLRCDDDFLTSKMLVFTPEKRCSIDEVIEHYHN